jgi:cytochrome c1
VTDFLSAVGNRVAQQWLAFLALPGLVFVAAVSAGHTLGQGRSLDLRLLTHAGTELAAHYQGRAVPALVAGVALAAAAAAVGLVARGLASALAAAWLASGKRGPAGWLLAAGTRARQRRWGDADQRYRDAKKAHADDAVLAQLAVARNDIALARPAHPTWMGDRLAAAGSRVYYQYGLDVPFSWPRLWLLLPDLARSEIRDASDSFTAAATVQAWGLLYLALGVVWWPSGVCGAFAAVLGWRRGRAAAAALADLVESAYDLHNRDLAIALGFSGPVDTVSGAEISQLIRKGS